MNTEQSPSGGVQPAEEKKKHWCNFCGFTSDSLTDYLAHSCVEVIEASGKKIEPTGQNACS